MPRKTITLEAPNGAKVRTVHSKRYFVVGYCEVDGAPKAAVIKRTDSAVAAYAAMRHRGNVIAFGVSADGEFKRPITTREMGWDADAEKSVKRFRAAVGNQGEARRLSY